MKRPILEKVIEFCRHIKDNAVPYIEKPLRSTDMATVVDAWYANFINVEKEMLLELMIASDYLEIKPLLELCCAKIASIIKNKSI